MTEIMQKSKKDAELFEVFDPSVIAEVRRAATELAVVSGFSPTKAGRVSIIASEAATNQIKHARGGYVLLQLLKENDTTGVEIIAIDRGPGIRYVARALNDGYSTAGSPGTGMGAMQRLADVFDIYSEPDQGTVLISQIWEKQQPEERKQYPVQVSAFSVPLQGEPVSGDGWSVAKLDRICTFMMADGLGHGYYASVAAVEAIDSFQKNAATAPVQVLTLTHTALRKTRGAAVSVAKIRFAQNKLLYAGIGNVTGLIVAYSERKQDDEGYDRYFLPKPEVHRAVNYDGIVGENIRRTNEFTYDFPPGSVLIMHTDGLSTHWDITQHRGLLKRHPSIIAGVIFRDAFKDRDDAAVLVARLQK